MRGQQKACHRTNSVKTKTETLPHSSIPEARAHTTESLSLDIGSGLAPLPLAPHCHLNPAHSSFFALIPLTTLTQSQGVCASACWSLSP